MKIKELTKKGLVMLTMMFALVMNAEWQPKQVVEFQTVMSMHETTYKSFIREGKYKEAIAPLTTLINLLDTTNIYKVANISEAVVRRLNAPYYYDLACCYAVTKEKKQALKALEQAVALGYNDYNNMLYDKDLTSLRKDKTYQALLTAVKEKTPLHVLRKSAPYDKDSVKLDVKFTYMPKDDYRLSVVRDYLKLDSVAGQGDELSKIINLLHFVHDNMPHDGNHRAFAEMDAIDLYNYVKTTGKGVNCRQLAISLCEMYLALGIPARYVTCLPADPLDHECHVINSVWSSQLQKWIWIDPTMDAWVMDENGTMLGIAEVRERLRNDLPLVLCETANWNHQNQQTKEYYLDYYMAKNLYFFACKKISRFNPESDYRENPKDSDFVLFPTGYSSDNWKGCDTTTDSDLFWAKPEM
ncbi:MAG: transglutaminase domain-containing protein [Prevotella sp.]|nr:transglutaminase domain-containing protein [Prevotella sp.]